MKGGDCKALTEEIEKALGEVRAPLAGAQLSALAVASVSQSYKGI